MAASGQQIARAPVLRTQRLVVRTIVPDDAAAVAALAGDWQVARMLADMPHPLSADMAARWTHAAVGERCLAITRAGEMIGSVSACVIEGNDGSLGSGHAARHDADALPAELGFWLGRAWWGHGYAREAVAAVIAGLQAVGDVTWLQSGHFTDNPASGRLLTALGFTPTGTTTQWCLARQETLPAVRYELRPAVAATNPHPARQARG